jgi:hypothetical protein
MRKMAAPSSICCEAFAGKCRAAPRTLWMPGLPHQTYLPLLGAHMAHSVSTMQARIRARFCLHLCHPETTWCEGSDYVRRDWHVLVKAERRADRRKRWCCLNTVPALPCQPKETFR